MPISSQESESSFICVSGLCLYLRCSYWTLDMLFRQGCIILFFICIVLYFSSLFHVDRLFQPTKTYRLFCYKHFCPLYVTGNSVMGVILDKQRSHIRQDCTWYVCVVTYFANIYTSTFTTFFFLLATSRLNYRSSKTLKYTRQVVCASYLINPNFGCC